MAAFFTRERFGRPQVYAGLLLLLFVAQCLWVMWQTPFREGEIYEISRGLAQWQHGDIARAPHSPLIALLASAGLSVLPDPNLSSTLVMLAARLPFLFLALLRAASLWYVSRRLYGNAGGYVALSLYCFSPPIIHSGALVNAAGPCAWGFFGGIFSAIALSHTVYALRESPAQQLLDFRHWRWRRVILLGVAFGICMGAQYVAAIVIPLALGFMLYLAPGRRTACVAIIAVAAGIAFGVLLCAYFFELPALLSSVTDAVQQIWKVDFVVPPLAAFLWAGPVLPLLLVAAVAVYVVWRRARYFGNTAPLVVLALLAGICLIAPMVAVFAQHALTFAFVFIAGVMADLLETSQRKWVRSALLILLALNAAITLRSLQG